MKDKAEKSPCHLSQYSQYESGVGDHLFEPKLVSGDDGHDVGDEMSHSGGENGDKNK